ncbi:hypothetical protein NCCP1664_01590 [Zafaria cholistanensis]|uniref:Flagellar biosynthetic protein FliO n=1 Tax=Zafaria cholistanensis TaxID=1682741 RepID=A0A5A7NN93_9MICC|nr:flagellar biosynthetic protein FliO [Zafaria cholistanensis]GER21662.1 hypothetical protein NCCP1664_01590 [Zafaria cholistanensis]
MDSLFLVLRVAVSLAAVLGLLWYLQRRFAGRLGAHPRAEVSVLSRTPLGPKSHAVVLQAHGRRYLLGVTEHGVSVLDGDLPPAPVFQVDPDLPVHPEALPHEDLPYGAQPAGDGRAAASFPASLPASFRWPPAPQQQRRGRRAL